MRENAHFNSIKVRLKRGVREPCRCGSHFNSIKVRLKLFDSYTRRDTKMDFNSIKVRLKLACELLNVYLLMISIP